MPGMRLPTPYEDELIGSVLMRARLHSGLPPSRLLMRLGVPEERQTTMFLPNGLVELAKNSKLDAEQLLWGHTVFPFAVAYMDQPTAHRYRDGLLTAKVPGATAGALVSHTAPRLRFCPECAREDLVKIGESYWRRSHCLPTSVICPNHSTPLSTPGYSPTSFSKQLVEPLPHRQQPGPGLREVIFPKWVVDAGVAATKVGADWQFRDDWHDIYRREALEQGFRSAGDVVASARLAHELRNAAGADCLSAMALDFEQNSHSWPTLMVRAKVAPKFASAKHLMLGAFLKQHTPAESTFNYARPGPQTADYAALDKKLSETVRRLTLELICSGRTTTLELLMAQTGAWQTFRCRKDKLPLTCATVEAFKSSAASKRRTGGSEVYQRRLAEIAAGRQKPMKSYRERREAELSAGGLQ